MDRVFTDPPALVGHRGFGKNAEGRPVENTIESIAAAVEEGVDWIEIDVRRTSADELVVLHDPAWTDGTVVVEQDAARLHDLGIVGLDEILDAVPPSVGLDIEVKPGAEDALVPPDRTPAGLLCPVLRREQGRRPLLVTSFDPATLSHVRERLPGVPLGYITWLTYPLDIAVASAAQLGVEVLMAHTVSYDEPKFASRRRPGDVVEVARKAGLELGVWAPAPEHIAHYVDMGVDAITVDDVPGALAALGRGDRSRPAPPCTDGPAGAAP
ncbi:MAG TPA: glycerophosphodiester phosphodiesterase [Streptosporangiales bacterium]